MEYNKKLLAARFEVIETYPNSPFLKGEVLHRINRATDDIYHTNPESPVGGIEMFEIEKYPHLFRKMNWWEDRTADEMPNRIVSHATDAKDIYEIIEWDMECLIGWIDKQDKTVCSLLAFNPEYGYFPLR